MRRTILVLSLLVISLVPFLSACDAAESQEIIYWAKTWAIANDFTDRNGNPNFGKVLSFTVERIVGISSAEGEARAAMDPDPVVRDMREANQEADQGWSAMSNGKNIEKDVLPHYDQAVSLRPDDWFYRNQRGIAYLQDAGNPDASRTALADFDKAAALAKSSGGSNEYLKMLKQREKDMSDIVMDLADVNARPTAALYQEQSRTCDELYKLTGDNQYLLKKQQADANIQ